MSDQLPPTRQGARASASRDPVAADRRRALVLLLGCVLLGMLLSVDWLYAGFQQLLAAARPVIAAHPLWGGVLFVLLSALSAMLAFFSSALLMPVALVTWGPLTTILLLWLGWLLGGASAYGLGRWVGRPLVRNVASARVTDYYLKRLPAQVNFPIALLIQLALPSEIPGYLFGTLRVRFRIYLLALALVEAPYAVGTVLLGENLIARQAGWMVAIAAVGIGTSLLALTLLHRRLGLRDAAEARRKPGRGGGSDDSA